MASLCAEPRRTPKISAGPEAYATRSWSYMSGAPGCLTMMPVSLSSPFQAAPTCHANHSAQVIKIFFVMKTHLLQDLVHGSPTTPRLIRVYLLRRSAMIIFVEVCYHRHRRTAEPQERLAVRTHDLLGGLDHWPAASKVELCDDQKNEHRAEGIQARTWGPKRT